ncbi:MAG: hypothetical protein EOP07_14825 [Proteobacteria bacterium]|nr:MAG: hypothetical protein EOP07_14825 [Pseudomonadota bacterium]
MLRREALVLGHPLVTFPVHAQLKVQSIGSGAKYQMKVENLRGWDLQVEIGKEQRPGYNPQSLLEVWIFDEISGRSIYGFAKYVQSSDSKHMILRIVEIDRQNHDFLQQLIEHSQPHEIRDAS